jgi:cobalamin biosynthesis Co2+ chelatase CbiK
MSQVQSALQQTLQEIQNLKRVQKHLDKINLELDSANRELTVLADRLEKEYQDIKQLESLSMKSLFHKILGSKEEQMEKERQEYLQATLKYNEFKKSLEILEFERTVLQKKLVDVSLLQNKLKTLKKQREQELLNSGTGVSQTLKRIHAKLDKLEIRRKEFDDAIVAGKKSSAIIDQMLHYLEKAKNWGDWDMMGKGRMASYNKHSAIDQAREASINAKYHLDRFQQELFDLGTRNYNFNLQINNLQNFTDIFFDNLISDWIMQQKIKNALANVYSVRDKVDRIVHSLEIDLEEITPILNDLQKEKESIILNS